MRVSINQLIERSIKKEIESPNKFHNGYLPVSCVKVTADNKKIIVVV